jgi:tryptophanyl-tRNA synthetase
MMVAQQMVYYQKQGAQIIICAADIEAYHMRNIPLHEGKKTAVEEFLLNYIALGLKPKNCDFYFQSSRSRNAAKAAAYYRMAQQAAKKTTVNELKDVYGELSPGKMISVLIQVADILHPQLPEFGGKKPVVVPVGKDQDPHIRFARDIAARFSRAGEYEFIPPSATYNEFMKGLGGGKMSSSDPLSYIALTDSPAAAKQKIMKYAFSGGGNTIEEHRKRGGNPDVDVSYQMLYYMFEEDDRKIRSIYDSYKSGQLLTGELKNMLIEKLTAFLTTHQELREKARDRIDEFLPQ